jgi:predicted nucleotidyltransferase
MENRLEEYKDIIIPIIIRYVPDAKIILYGSRARGNDKTGSDIDIALDMGSTIDSALINNITWDLEDSNLPIFFDIVDYAKMPEAMKKNILKDGVIWKK